MGIPVRCRKEDAAIRPATWSTHQPGPNFGFIQTRQPNTVVSTPHMLPRRTALLTVLVLLAAVFLPAAPARAATATVRFRGSVTCPSGYPFAGAWVESSGGGSGFATNSVMPGTDNRLAIVSRTLTNVTVPTILRINVGCGLKANGTDWKKVYNGLGRTSASGAGMVFINVSCTTTSCTTAPRGNAGSTTRNPATTTNPADMYGQEWCTYRASAFWKQMTGSFPSWSGDAGAWDNNAPAQNWAVRSWPEPDTLMIWQPPVGTVGHVGYVAHVRNNNGTMQVKIYDRNWDGQPYNQQLFNRDGKWEAIPAGARFIRVPPRFTTHIR